MPDVYYQPGWHDDWYWLADDGRLFASQTASMVTVDDEGFRTARAAGKGWTVWPRDDAGAQTDAALNEVLRVYGLNTKGKLALVYGDDLIAVLSDAELTAMAGGTMRDQRMLSAQRSPFAPTDDVIVRLAAIMKVEPAAWFVRLKA